LNTLNETETIYQKFDDNQKVILKKIESIEKSIANLALTGKTNLPISICPAPTNWTSHRVSIVG